MSWSRSSKLGLVLLSVLVLFAAVGVASAVSVEDEQAPEEAEVSEEVTVTVELQDLFAQESSWNLNGQTQLQDAQWTIELYQGDELLDTRESSGNQPDQILFEEGVTDADRVVVTITGTVPGVTDVEGGEYTYEERETFLAGEVVQIVDGDVNRLSQLNTHHYTAESREARTALDDADDAIQSASTDTSDAESTFDEAVTAYNDGNFDEAVSLAEDAQSQAQSSSDGSDDGSSDDGSTEDGSDGDSTDDGSSDGSDDGSTTNDSTQDGSDGNASAESSSDGGDDGGILWILLYALLGLLILGAVGGGIYWYQQQQQGPNRDPLG